QTDTKYVYDNKDPEAEQKRLPDALDQAKATQISAQRQLENAEHILSQLLDKQRQLTEQVTTVKITLSNQEDT
ncbi:hypothetical protein, partial [Psychrobacter proteolyticus]|uniref:hypothetical protein n=1 Tax=Psychrobacter proteolyticus TaxID=147825 RepID=UPI00311E685A